MRAFHDLIPLEIVYLIIHFITHIVYGRRWSFLNVRSARMCSRDKHDFLRGKSTENHGGIVRWSFELLYGSKKLLFTFT